MNIEQIQNELDQEIAAAIEKFHKATDGKLELDFNVYKQVDRLGKHKTALIAVSTFKRDIERPPALPTFELR